MTDHEIAERLRHYVAQTAQRYPGAWAQLEDFRQRRRELGDWPDWCLVPMAGAVAIAGDAVATDPTAIARVAALGAWRYTQGIYRFDRDLLDAIWETPVKGELPVEILHRLPEWCVYVETPGRTGGLVGFFAHLDHDVNTGRGELRLLLDFDGEGAPRLLPGILHLGGTVAGAVAAALAEGARRGGPRIDAAWWASTLEPMVSTVLYLCSENADITGGRESAGIPPWAPGRLRVASGAYVLPVGHRIGEMLRNARRSGETAAGPGGGRVAHVRRAHWHTYLTGSRKSPVPALRWLSPVLVGTGDLAPTVRRVRANT